jgi:hypothetical protein
MATQKVVVPSKTRAKVEQSLALERELGVGGVPGRKTKPAATTLSSSMTASVGGAAAVGGVASTVSAAPTSLQTAANDDYEASKVAKRSIRAERDEERGLVADLDKWDAGVFSFSSASAALDDDEDSF